MSRKISRLIKLLTLVLAVASAGLWLRSHWRWDSVVTRWPAYGFGMKSESGIVAINLKLTRWSALRAKPGWDSEPPFFVPWLSPGGGTLIPFRNDPLTPNRFSLTGYPRFSFKRFEIDPNRFDSEVIPQIPGPLLMQSKTHQRITFPHLVHRRRVRPVGARFDRAQDLCKSVADAVARQVRAMRIRSARNPPAMSCMRDGPGRFSELAMADSTTERLMAFKARVDALAAIIGAPEKLLPTYGQTEDGARPHIEATDDGQCHFVVVERGQELERVSSANMNEILYRVFDTVVFSMAIRFELHHRTPLKDPRRQMFAKRLELMGVLSQQWRERTEADLRATLERHPFVDGRI